MGSGLGTKMRSWLEDHPAFVVVSLSAVLVVSVTTVAGGVGDVVRWIDERWDWRDDEYGKLAGLQAGTNLALFEDELGVPRYVLGAPEARYRESLFEGRDYWVQAISDRSGTVEMFLVTSCAESFTPTFDVPGLGPVTLRKSTFASLVPEHSSATDSPQVPDRTVPGDVPHLSYHASLGTDRDSFLEYWYGAGPGLYQEFAWGLTDPCPDFIDQLNDDVKKAMGPSLDFESQPNQPLPKPIVDLRRSTPVNTYAEVAPQRTFERIAREVPIGLDRLRTQVVETGSSGAR